MLSARHLAILLLIQARGHMSARDLSRAFGVSTRTIARDLDALNGRGVPVSSGRGPGGGYVLAPDVPLDPRRFIMQENQPETLTATAAPVGPAGRAGDVDAARIELLRVRLLELEATLPEEYRRDLERARAHLVIDAMPGDEDSAQPRYLATMRAALWRSRRLRIRCVASDGGASEWHLLDPYVLLPRAGVWYLIAYCHNCEDMRTFVVDRVEVAELVDETASGPETIDLQLDWEHAPELPPSSARPVQVWLLLDEDGVRTVRAEGLLRGAPSPAGDTLWMVALEFPQATQAVHYVLHLGAWARVLAPAEVRARVAEHVRALSRVYGVSASG